MNVNYECPYYEILFQSRVTSSILVPHMFINTVLESPQPIPLPQYERPRFAPIKKRKNLILYTGGASYPRLTAARKKIGKLKK